MSCFILTLALLTGSAHAGTRDTPRALQSRIEAMEPGPEKSRVELELVDMLRDRGFLNAARSQAVEIALRGPDDVGFPYAVTRVVELDDELHNPLGLQSLLTQLDSSELRPIVPDALDLHTLANLSATRRQRAEAGERISVHSSRYAPAKLILGHLGVGCLKPSIMSFREVMTAPSGTDDTKDKALFRVAATYADLERYENAAKYYAAMDPDAYVYAAARCEEAAAHLAPGLPKSIRGQDPDPDAALAAIAAARSAQHPDAELALAFLEAFTHGWNTPHLEGPRQQAIALENQLADARAMLDEGPPSSVALRWFADASTADDALGRVLRGHVHRNAPLRETLGALVQLEVEEARLARDRRLPTDRIRLEHRRARAAYQDRAARLLAEGLTTEHAHVERLLFLANAIQLDLEWDFYENPQQWFAGSVFCRPADDDVPEYGVYPSASAH